MLQNLSSQLLCKLLELLLVLIERCLQLLLTLGAAHVKQQVVDAVDFSLDLRTCALLAGVTGFGPTG